MQDFKSCCFDNNKFKNISIQELLVNFLVKIQLLP